MSAIRVDDILILVTYTIESGCEMVAILCGRG